MNKYSFVAVHTIQWFPGFELPNGPGEFFETEIIKSIIGADSAVGDDWAAQHDDDIETTILDILQDGNYPVGIYGFTGFWVIESGKDADSWDGPGDYWSNVNVDKYSLRMLSRDDVEAMDIYSDGELDKIFAEG